MLVFIILKSFLQIIHIDKSIVITNFFKLSMPLRYLLNPIGTIVILYLKH